MAVVDVIMMMIVIRAVVVQADIQAAMKTMTMIAIIAAVLQAVVSMMMTTMITEEAAVVQDHLTMTMMSRSIQVVVVEAAVAELVEATTWLCWNGSGKTT